jgi:predicted NUDIX family NTP pyrophosphohydrolase
MPDRPPFRQWGGVAMKQSAGLLLFRRCGNAIEVLLGHPGGPFWEGRETGAWTIPKGGMHPGEQPLDAAIREFREETGFEPNPPFIDLGAITQRSGKVVFAWAFEGDCDPSALVSIEARTEWPPRSRRYIQVPEIDRGAFFSIEEAKRLINLAQAELLDRLVERLTANG